jgi:metal-responsive CopG/Arc/MetJ family transcriptional regulator
MRITISLPDQLASRFLALVPNRERSATIARLLEQELAQRESALEQACLAANANQELANEIEVWQGVNDNSEESPTP